jgi:hypothetical protein
LNVVDFEATIGRVGRQGMLVTESFNFANGPAPPTAALGDFVWHDTNADGIQDAGELGIPGVTVELWLCGPDGISGTADDVFTGQTDVTDGAGLYLFDNLTPGDYFVRFLVPAGYVVSPRDQGANDAVDSDADTTSGITVCTNLTSGETDLTWDAGLVRLVPGIDIEKTTDGPSNANPIDSDYDNEDAPNGPGVPVLTPGSAVTWTYKVTNTGNVPFAAGAVVIVDDHGTPGNPADDLSTTGGQITFASVQSGDADNLLEPGEVWLYQASGTVADLTSLGAPKTFNFSGSSATDGADGNIRSFTAGSVSVKASAFSRDKASGTWSAAYLGSYGGLDVTDGSEGNGANNTHTVDNVGRDNYVLFEFSETVVVDSAFLGYVVDDSDLTVWIGSIPNAFTNHQTLSDAVLAGLGFTEVNLTDLASTRTANLNAGNLAGNVLVIAAWTGDDTPDDRFKIEKVTVRQPQPGTYENRATVAAPGAPGDSDLSHYTNPEPAESTKFYVVNDAGSDRTYEYGPSGASGENYSISAGNTAPRGIASTAAGDRVWVVDANKKVYVYDTAGTLLGSWSAGGLAANAVVEGIATNGTDIWIVDACLDKVYRYTGAASRLSGSQSAASSFALNTNNKNPKDVVTDGSNLWVVNDSTSDKVFKYTTSGSLVGSWTISGAGSSPTGITLDPSVGSGHLWIVDSGTDKVYQFNNARGCTSGSLSPSTHFVLAAGNTNPQGIADPPAGPGQPVEAPPGPGREAGRGPDGDRPRNSPAITASRRPDPELPLWLRHDQDLTQLAIENLRSRARRLRASTGR